MHLANSALLAISLCLAADTAGAYEILFNTGTNCKSSVVHKVPISHRLEGVAERGNVLQAEGSADQMRISDINGLGKALAQFKDGRLVRFWRDGDESAREKDESYLCENPDRPTQLTDLWRKPPAGDKAAWNYWANTSRIRLWFFNPNAAGTLFAEIALMMLAAALFILRKDAVRIAVGCGAAAPAVFLIMTKSRGSFIALAAGGLAVVATFFLLRKVGWKVLAMAGIAALGLIGTFAFGLGGDRFGKNLVAVDRGNVQRLRAWRAAPAMMAAAPGGWGEKCGHAYNEWFQQENDTHILSYLVNTHLTWMVGKGWVFSFFYVSGWCLLFLLLTTHSRERWNAMALGMWILFFVANWFSTLGFFFSLWVIPLLCTVPASIHWGTSVKRAWKSHIGFCLVAPLIALGTIWGMIAMGNANLAKMEVPVRNDGKVVYVGKGKPIAHVVPDLWVLCRYRYGSMGRDIRTWCKAHKGEGSIAVVDSVGKLPAKTDRLVLVGRSCREYMRRLKMASKDRAIATQFPVANHLVFISPNLTIGKISGKLAGALRLKVFSGEFLAEVTGDANLGRPWLKIIPKCELYLPDWLELALDGGAE